VQTVLAQTLFFLAQRRYSETHEFTARAGEVRLWSGQMYIL